MHIEERAKTPAPDPGALKNEKGIPYDYIVIIDAGLKGSRVYVYNWLNPKHALDAGHDLTLAPKINLTKNFLSSLMDLSDRELDLESEGESDSEDELHFKKVKYPVILNGKNWSRKVTPGLSSFAESPQKLKKHHLDYLLQLASAVVPKSQHSRTPIFLHATAGMRLLLPSDQAPILETACEYLQANSDFFIPDCTSHVNVIDGDTEGIYGWLSINYMIQAFDKPELHQHGKNHTTYGLLDMGGASTQVVFQPNTTEMADHTHNLYRISMLHLPSLGSDNGTTIGKYEVPEFETFNVFSDLFLGFGMYQALDKYRKGLIEAHDMDPSEKHLFKGPITDPCLPLGATLTDNLDDTKVDFLGASDFQGCLNSIFPVLANASDPAANLCQQLAANSLISSCLLSDLIPAFDFDVNHFVGVSGYWDALNKLLSPSGIDNDDNEDQTQKYDYRLIYDKTQELCSLLLTKLLGINNKKPPKERMKEDLLMQLCFKSLWILNFLHVGLGFPRLGIDELESKDRKFKSLQLVEKMGGSSFSWTLGRAFLYANDEYVQAFNNYTLEQRAADEKEVSLARPGYGYNAGESNFNFGAELASIPSRPQYVEPVKGETYPTFDYESQYKVPDELKWYIQPHRYYGGCIFLLMIACVVYLMMGHEKRTAIKWKIRSKILKLRNDAIRLTGRSTYGPLPDVELEAMPGLKDDNDRFVVESDDEEQLSH